tara:strand:+ start:183 stop:383 length:201 start_codon:yes stop_codon:yes gene_type:complete
MKLTYKKESKELETALEVVRCLIDVTKNEINDNNHDKISKKQSKFELHQLYGVECLLECADYYYED